MRTFFAYLTILFFLLSACDTQKKKPIYKDASQSIEKRVKDLLSRMTIQEKARQMDMYGGGDFIIDGQLSPEKAKKVLQKMSIGCVHDYYPEKAEYANALQHYIIENTRLGIPALFIEEALHGYQGKKATAFPVPIGLASMWNRKLMYKIGRAVAKETRSVGVHMVLSPVLGLAREPRWGRVQETYGEDSFLAAECGIAYAGGLQGSDLTRDDAVVAEPKHFGIHSIPEGGKNTAPVYIGEREARSQFLYVFERVYKETGALGCMAAYHEWDGKPAVSDPFMLKQLLRKEWGFKGFVLSDLGAINRLNNTHFTAPTPEDAVIQAISGGLDMQFYDYSHDVFQGVIINGVKQGKLKIQDVDRAVSSILYVKFRLGLFDNPYTKTDLKAKRYHNTAHQELAKKAADESIILLKNKKKILPISENKKVALIGAFANEVMLGGYSPKEVEGISIVQAFSKSKNKVEYVDLSSLSNSLEDISERYFRTEKGENGLFAEYFNNTSFKGEPSTTNIVPNVCTYWHNLSPMPGINDDNFSVRYSGYLIPEQSGEFLLDLVADDLARVYINNQLVIDNWANDKKNIHGKTKIHLTRGKKYAIKIEYTELTDYAGIALQWQLLKAKKAQRNLLFAKAIKAVQKADIAVLVLGECMSETGEGKDKISLQMNPFHQELIKILAKEKKPIVLVLQNGRPLAFTEQLSLVDAVLETWYAGEKGGASTVDILLGKVNPSGKLPVSIPRYDGQLPIYYNYKRSSVHGYVDGSNQPLFAFGHGLSYSDFKYSNLTLKKSQITPEETVKISLKLKNTSKIEGAEVVQLYLVDEFSSVTTPVKQLRGFQRIKLKAGEERKVQFNVKPEQLALWNSEMKKVVEAGQFTIHIGSSSDDIRLSKTFEVK